MQEKRNITRAELGEDQKTAIEHLDKWVDEVRDECITELQVAAVTGQRGLGKTTVLEVLKNKISEQDKGCEPIWIDASSIATDFGLIAEVLMQIRTKYAPPAATEHSRCFSNPDPINNGEDLYNKCMETAMMQQEGHRALAHELAMSTRQYTHLLIHAAETSKEYKHNLKKFIEIMDKEMSRRWEAQSHEKKKPPILVMIDDLDLSEGHMAYHFCKSLATDFRKLPVLFILSYNREQLLHLLASGYRNLKKKSNNREVSLGWECARALITKIIPNSNQFDLRRWSYAKCLSFESIKEQQRREKKGEKSVRTLQQLLNMLGISEICAAIPDSPRGLENFYDWAVKQLDTAEKKDHTSPPHLESLWLDAFLQALIFRGDFELIKHFEKGNLASFTSGFEWDNDVLTEMSWQNLVDNVHQSNFLWGLPVLPMFHEVKNNESAVAYTETIIDHSLKTSTLSPFRLFEHRSFLAERMKRSAGFEIVVSLQQLEGFLADDKHSQFLRWHEWVKTNEHADHYILRFEPLNFWLSFTEQRPYQFLYEIGKRFAIIPNLYIPDPGQENGNPFSMIPTSIRGIILLVDGLTRLPWKEINLEKHRWDIETYSRCVALYMLAGYTYHLRTFFRESNSPSPCPILLQSIWRGNPETIKDASPGEFPGFMKEVTTYLRGQIPDFTENKTKLSDIQRQLLISLEAILDMPVYKTIDDKTDEPTSP